MSSNTIKTGKTLEELFAETLVDYREVKWYNYSFQYSLLLGINGRVSVLCSPTKESTAFINTVTPTEDGGLTKAQVVKLMTDKWGACDWREPGAEPLRALVESQPLEFRLKRLDILRDINGVFYLVSDAKTMGGRLLLEIQAMGSEKVIQATLRRRWVYDAHSIPSEIKGLVYVENALESAKHTALVWNIL